MSEFVPDAELRYKQEGHPCPFCNLKAIVRFYAAYAHLLCDRCGEVVFDSAYYDPIKRGLLLDDKLLLSGAIRLAKDREDKVPPKVALS